jgi:5-(carboxyamino)imidazole ribonucleotide synthase
MNPLPPGSTLGVFGGGQLGRMFAQAAARIGYRVHVFAPENNPPAAHVSAYHTRAAYDNLDAVSTFGASVDAVTYEFENIPAGTVAALEKIVPIRPAPGILAITRNRITEKSFLQKKGIPVTPFAHVQTPEALVTAVEKLGGAAVIKTTELGYDGKGQIMMSVTDDPQVIWSALGAPSEVIAEKRIELHGECSILLARDASGRTATYGPFNNEHSHHILDVTTWSAMPHDDTVARRALDIGHAVADALALEGLICVELFIAPNGEVMVNEIAPRPHNSGHLTIEAFSISQFEQQARLTAGHAAVTPAPRAPAAAMANLLGDLWEHGEPDWSPVLGDPRLSLHVYGKKEARPGRKMGHVTALASTAHEAADIVRKARDRLRRA